MARFHLTRLDRKLGSDWSSYLSESSSLFSGAGSGLSICGTALTSGFNVASKPHYHTRHTAAAGSKKLSSGLEGHLDRRPKDSLMRESKVVKRTRMTALVPTASCQPFNFVFQLPVIWRRPATYSVRPPPPANTGGAANVSGMLSAAPPIATANCG